MFTRNGTSATAMTIAERGSRKRDVFLSYYIQKESLHRGEAELRKHKQDNGKKLSLIWSIVKKKTNKTSAEPESTM